MTHFTDLCNWFIASEPDEVVVLQHGLLNNGVLIKYKAGELASIIMSGNGTFGYPKELYEVMGNGGIVVVDHMLEVRTAGIEGVSDKVTYPMLVDRHKDIGTEGGLSGWLAKKRVACAEAYYYGQPHLAEFSKKLIMAAHEREPIMSKAKGSEEDQEQFWRMAFETWQSSGLSIRKFCKDEGLSEPQFYTWRKKLAGCGTQLAIQDGCGQPAFIEVALPKNNDVVIELLLTSGNTMRIHPGIDSVTFGTVVSVLHQAGLC